MEILLPNNCGFPKLAAVRGQADALSPSPVTWAPNTALGEMLEVSAQGEGWPLLLVSSVSTSVVQQCCPAYAGSLAAPGQRGQQRNLSPALTYGHKGGTQLRPL